MNLFLFLKVKHSLPVVHCGHSTDYVPCLIKRGDHKRTKSLSLRDCPQESGSGESWRSNTMACDNKHREANQRGHRRMSSGACAQGLGATERGAAAAQRASLARPSTGALALPGRANHGEFWMAQNDFCDCWVENRFLLGREGRRPARKPWENYGTLRRRGGRDCVGAGGNRKECGCSVWEK